MKSNATWNTRGPKGIVDVVSPRAVSAKVTFHQSLRNGVNSSLTLPTICVHICSVARLSFQSAYGNAGQASSLPGRGLSINSDPNALAGRAASAPADSDWAASVRSDSRGKWLHAIVDPERCRAGAWPRPRPPMDFQVRGKDRPRLRHRVPPRRAGF